MEQIKPATPAQAAAPGNVEPVKTQPSSSSAPVTENGNKGKEEGKVTITTKEYADLQRAKARTLSFEKRMELGRKPINADRGANGNGTTPEAQAIADAEDRADQAERRALQSEIRDNVRNILAKPEFASLPKSTKDLILANPAMLSEADNLEEALLDIEDRLLELAGQDGDGGIPVTVKNGEAGARPAESSHETPPTSASGASAPEGGVMEDTSKLTGSQRSRAILRNMIREKRGGIK